MNGVKIKKLMRLFSYATYIAVLIGAIFYLLTIRFTGSDNDVIVVYIMCGLVGGSAAMMSVFGLSLYLNRPKERNLLYFGLFCASAALRMFFLEKTPGHFIFPAIPYDVILLLRTIGNAGAGLFLFLFIVEVFGRRHVKLLSVIGSAWMLAWTLITLLSKIFFSLEGTVLSSILSLSAIGPMLICAAVVILRSGQMSRAINKAYLVTTMVCLFSTSLMLFGLPNFEFTWNFIYLIMNTLLMADRYAKAIDAVEHSNETLERTVNERTAELRQANEQVTTSERQLKELVTNISHDLKTPLTVVGLNLERLTDPELSPSQEDARRMASVAYNKTQDLQRLTRNLFDAVRMEEGRVSYRPVWTSLSGLLSEVYRRYADYADSAEVTLAVRYGEDMELWLDPEKIWSVFDNVINNSLRYTAKGGSITVTAERADEGTARLTIADTGSGIEPAHLPHIFERYYKANPSRGDKSGDSGLGLYIVKTVVEGVEGSVSAASVPGEGTAIIVTLRARACGSDTIE